jgi:hypothetical protein
MRPDQARAAAILRTHFDADYDRRMAEKARKKLLADLREVVNSIPGLSSDNPKDDTWTFVRGSRKLVVRVTATDFTQWGFVSGARQDLTFFEPAALAYDAGRGEIVVTASPGRPDADRLTAVEHLAIGLVEALKGAG